MTKPTRPSPQNVILYGLVFGALFGFFFGYFFPAPTEEDVPVVTVLVGNVAFAAMLSGAYYFIFRSPVVNVKLDVTERTKFVGLYLLWVGMIIGAEGTRFLFGASLLDVATTMLFVVVGLSISYRKLFQRYHAAGQSSGGNPPAPPAS